MEFPRKSKRRIFEKGCIMEKIEIALQATAILMAFAAMGAPDVYPYAGKMIVETASGRNLDGTFTVVVALSSAPPPAASTKPK